MRKPWVARTKCQRRYPDPPGKLRTEPKGTLVKPTIRTYHPFPVPRETPESRDWKEPGEDLENGVMV